VAVVSVVQNSNIKLAVQEAINLVGGIKNFVRPHDRVVIKPNLVFALPYDTGFTTDPRVVQAIVQLCKSADPLDVIIAEGAGGTDTKLAFKRCGYSELARRYDVKLVDLNESQTTAVAVPDGKGLQMLNIPNIILESDVLINVPKLKLYRDTNWASLAVKNLVGAIPGKGEYSRTASGEFSIELSPEFWKPEGRFFLPHHQQWWSPRGEKKRVHTNLAEGIVDLNTVIKPSLNVIDAIIACHDIDMTHTKGEKSMELNTILAGRDPLALDCIATKIGGHNPLDISYLKRAAERGVGESDYNRIQVVGTPLDRIVEAWKTGFANKQGNSKSTI
jgi:uncharacterized protein (DUF362 family)